MKISFLFQKSTRFTDEKRESFPSLPPSEVALEWSREEYFSGQRCFAILAMAPTQVVGEPSRCHFLGSCLPNCAADTVISLPLAVISKF